MTDCISFPSNGNLIGKNKDFVFSSFSTYKTAAMQILIKIFG